MPLPLYGSGGLCERMMDATSPTSKTLYPTPSSSSFFEKPLCAPKRAFRANAATVPTIARRHLSRANPRLPNETLTPSSVCSIITTEGNVWRTSPFGPRKTHVCPSCVTITPGGIGIGFFARRLMLIFTKFQIALPRQLFLCVLAGQSTILSALNISRHQSHFWEQKFHDILYTLSVPI